MTGGELLPVLQDEWLCDFHHSTNVIWSEMFVDNLVAHPDEWQQCLRS